MSDIIRSRSLVFTGPRAVQIQTREVAAPGPEEVVVQSLVSAISGGSELLVYRSQIPEGMAVDETIGALQGKFAYPLRYGYAVVGRVVARGAEVDEIWQNRLVFAFHPHESQFVTRPEFLLPVPEGIGDEAAAFLPNMETAVSFVMDGRPVIGERAVVFGQGIVGLLTTALLTSLPLATLVTVDGHPLRRDWSQRLGAGMVFEVGLPDLRERITHTLATVGQEESGADLVYELSGNPEALQQAIEVAGFGGRVVVGSWYGQKPVTLDLGEQFHRNHLRLMSSQVSHLAPRWHARWSKARRLAVAWKMVARHRPERLVTHRFPLGEAAAAYRLLDERPEEALQVLLIYQ